MFKGMDAIVHTMYCCFSCSMTWAGRPRQTECPYCHSYMIEAMGAFAEILRPEDNPLRKARDEQAEKTQG